MKPPTPLILTMAIAALGLTACADQAQTILPREQVVSTSTPVTGGSAAAGGAVSTPVTSGPLVGSSPASTPVHGVPAPGPSPARTSIHGDPVLDPSPPGTSVPGCLGTTPVNGGPGTTRVHGGPAPLGVLQGHLYVTGGPAPGMKAPRAGTVVVTRAGCREEIAVGEDGAYSVAVLAGTYRVAGTNPRIAPAPCSGRSAVAVARGATVVVDVSCPVP